MGKAKLSKRQLLVGVGVGVFLLLAIGAGVGTRWWIVQQQAAKDAAQKATDNKLDNIQSKALGGNYDEAHKALNDELSKSSLPKEEKYRLLIQQGVTYENQKDYDNAIKSYQAAGAIDDTRAVAEAIARVAEAKGDLELAKTEYQKAISLISASEPMSESYKKYYEYRLANLGKKEE